MMTASEVIKDLEEKFYLAYKSIMALVINGINNEQE